MTASADYRPLAAWSIALLLTGLSLINFLDKIVLGMVAVPLMAEFNLSPAAFGVIAGSFFWLFSVSAVAGGFLANRISTRWILLAMAVTWSLLQVPLAFAAGVLPILSCRVILGAMEGPAAPVSVHAVFKWFPNHKRSLPVAVINQGAALGVIVAGLVIPLVTRGWGWRMNFLLLAAIGAIWSVLWLCFGREGQLQEAAASYPGVTSADGHATAKPARLPYRTILSSPYVLLVFLLGFAAYWTLGLVLTWLPAYLEKGLGFNGITAGRLFAMVVLCSTPTTIGLCWLSQRLLTNGASTRKARVQLINFCFVLSGALFLALVAFDLTPMQKVLLFTFASAPPAVCFALASPILAELVPAGQRGAIFAIHTALSSLAGVIAPAVMGRLLQAHGTADAHGYETGFLIGAVVLIASALASLCFLHPERASQVRRTRATEPA
ncbi:MFS transporter [Paraburkholderia sediminicola]|uniref:MFS transporter n=1 Tax=Paraburkholderia sediminicola TaxID=458836 RepID=UPI0038B919FE